MLFMNLQSFVLNARLTVACKVVVKKICKVKTNLSEIRKALNLPPASSNEFRRCLCVAIFIILESQSEKLWHQNYKLRHQNYKLRHQNQKLRPHAKLQVTPTKLQVTPTKLQVTRSKLTSLTAETNKL